MKKLELRKVTTFTEAMVGKLVGKPFVLLQKHEGLDIPFKWIWPVYNCENCGHHKQEIVEHRLTVLGVYAPQDKALEPLSVWIGFTKDGRIMSIPKTRRAELMSYLPAVENVVS